MSSNFSHIVHQPIPPLPLPKNWKKVKILEKDEELVPLDKMGFVVKPIYYLRGIKGALKEAFLRERAARLLKEARKLLPKGWNFIIWDAFRPLEVQQQIFDTYLKAFHRKHPYLPKERLLKLAGKYVSPPILNSSIPPHNTGGAVDLTLCDERRRELPMGTDFDDFSPKAATRYFERKQKLTQKEIVYRRNRRILYHTLTSIGFTNYPKEWWHFDFGDQLWGKISNKTAFYGAIKDPWPIKGR